MDLTETLKTPFVWIANNPLILLTGVPTLIPALIAFIAFQPVMEKLVRLFSQPNVTAYFVQNASLLISKAIPYLGLVLFLIVLSFLLHSYVGAAYADLAKSLRAGKKPDFSKAFSAANTTWLRFLWRSLAAGLSLIASFLVLVALAIPFALLGAAFPPLVVVLVILGVLAAMVIGLFYFFFTACGYPFLLPASIYETKGPWDTVRLVMDFVWKNKGRSLAYLLVTVVFNYLISLVVSASWPFLWLYLPLSLLLGLITHAWTQLAPSLMWLEYAEETFAAKPASPVSAAAGSTKTTTKK